MTNQPDPGPWHRILDPERDGPKLPTDEFFDYTSRKAPPPKAHEPNVVDLQGGTPKPEQPKRERPTFPTDDVLGIDKKPEQPKRDRRELWKVWHEGTFFSEYSTREAAEHCVEMHPDAANCEIEHLRQVVPGDPDYHKLWQSAVKQVNDLTADVNKQAAEIKIHSDTITELESETWKKAAEIERLRKLYTQTLAKIQIVAVDGKVTDEPESEAFKTVKRLRAERDQLSAELESLKSENDRLEIMAGEGAEKLKQRTDELAEQRKLQPVDDNGNPICQSAFNHVFSEYQAFRDRSKKLAAELETVKAERDRLISEGVAALGEPPSLLAVRALLLSDEFLTEFAAKFAETPLPSQIQVLDSTLGTIQNREATDAERTTND